MADPIHTFYSPQHQQHDPPAEYLHGRPVPYFEKPQRIEIIKQALLEAGLIDLHEPDAPIPKSEIARAHDPGMVDYFEHLSQNVREVIRRDFHTYEMEDDLTGDEYYYESVFPPRESAHPESRRFYIFDSTSPIGPHTWAAIHHSATLAYAGAEALLNGTKHAYALCRPPGHHAGRNFAGGYCYFNNAAIAANKLTASGRVALLDIDYHHGNGTQDILWTQDEILFVSLHADPLLDYPYYSGFTDELGFQAAEGLTLNFPLALGTDEARYLETLDEALHRIQAFAPSSLVVSLGFDTYKDDPMAKFALEVESFAKIGRAIAAIDLPTLYVQEGGYALDSLGAMAVSFFQGVLDAT